MANFRRPQRASLPASVQLGLASQGGLTRSQAFLNNVATGSDDHPLSSSSEESLPIFDDDDEEVSLEIETDV